LLPILTLGSFFSKSGLQTTCIWTSKTGEKSSFLGLLLLSHYFGDRAGQVYLPSHRKVGDWLLWEPVQYTTLQHVVAITGEITQA
jgi:hypothetical protein